MFPCPLLLDFFLLPTKFQVRRWPPTAQWMQWFTFLWIGVGLWILLSASYSTAHEQFQDGLYYVRRQILWITLGLLAYAWILTQTMPPKGLEPLCTKHRFLKPTCLPFHHRGLKNHYSFIITCTQILCQSENNLHLLLKLGGYNL